MFFAFISIAAFAIMVGILSSLVPVTHLFTAIPIKISPIGRKRVNRTRDVLSF